MNITDIIHQSLHAKRVEPEPRMCGGKFGYVFHKYPIKNGISPLQLMALNMEKTKSLMNEFSKKYHEHMS